MTSAVCTHNVLDLVESGVGVRVGQHTQRQRVRLFKLLQDQQAFVHAAVRLVNQPGSNRLAVL